MKSDELFEIRTKIGRIKTNRNVNAFLSGCYVLSSTMAGFVLPNTLPIIFGIGAAGTAGIAHAIKAVSDQSKLKDLEKRQDILEESYKMR